MVIQKALSADHDVTSIETARQGHATRLAMAAANASSDVVVVLGGDGTLNEAANGLVGSNTALAPLPGGSTNVFSRILGLPDDPVDAVGVLSEALERGAIERIGLGSVNERYFLFHCGIGFDAAVVQRVEQSDHLKRWAGHPLFVYAAIGTWLSRSNRRQAPVTVHDSQGGAAVRGAMTVVLNSNPYTFLGNRPLNLVSEATLDAPLAAVTFSDLSLVKLLPLLARSLRNRDVAGSRGCDVRTGLNQLTITSEQAVPYQVDGDHLGSTRRLEFLWTPEAMPLVMP